MDSDRRQYSRNEPAKLVYARFGKTNGGIVLNASPGGLCYQAVAPTQPSSVVELIVSPSIKESIGLTGRIVWTDRDGKMGGLEFVGLPPEVKERLMEWLLPQVPADKLETGTMPMELHPWTGPSGATLERITPLNSMPAQTASQVAAPTFELPKNYGKTSTIPRMFGGLSEVADISATEPIEETPKSGHWFLRAVANLILAGLLLLLPAVYIYNFHPLLANSWLDRGAKLYSSLEGLVRGETSNPEAPRDPSTPKRDSLPVASSTPETEKTSNSTTPAIPESSQEQPPAVAKAQAAAPEKAVPAVEQESAPQPQILKRAIPKPDSVRGVSQPKLPIDPNDPNELWLAVGQGDTNAEVSLANLYLTGRLVKKNCEQGRVLLTAAAKKGNAEAISALRDLLRNGCR